MGNTISDFGAQWLRFQENTGYYASQAMFADICRPLLELSEIRDLEAADLGSGTGRIVTMLLGAGASRVTAVEPSDAFSVLEKNLAGHSGAVRLVHATADQLPEGPYDLVVSIGVLHHIPDPGPAVARAYSCLKPGGRMLVWLYGKEGNRLYLGLARPVRALTKRLPDWMLNALCQALTGLLSVYIALCRVLPLPMRQYMRRVLASYGWRQRLVTVFDQLNPSYAKYYTEKEARQLMERAGFTEVRMHHRHGYSWTVLGQKTEHAA